MRKKLGENARKKVLETYRAERVVDMYLDVYKAVAD